MITFCVSIPYSTYNSNQGQGVLGYEQAIKRDTGAVEVKYLANGRFPEFGTAGNICKITIEDDDALFFILKTGYKLLNTEYVEKILGEYRNM